jgi:hypothetical protein
LVLRGNLFLDVGQGAQDDRNLMRIEGAFNVPLIVFCGSPLTFDVPKHPDVHFPHLLENILSLWRQVVHAPSCRLLPFPEDTTQLSGSLGSYLFLRDRKTRPRGDAFALLSFALVHWSLGWLNPQAFVSSQQFAQFASQEYRAGRIGLSRLPVICWQNNAM